MQRWACHVLIQLWLVLGLFQYIVYRVQRALKIQ